MVRAAKYNTTNGAVVAAVGVETVATEQVTNRWGISVLTGLPRGKPGRRPGATGKKAVGKTVYVFENQALGRGKPSDAQLAGRMVVCLQPGENYNPAVHGLGMRDPQDDIKLECRFQDRAYKNEIKANLAASAKLARDAERAARKASKVNATVAAGSPTVENNVNVPAQAVNSSVSAPAQVPDNETVAV